MPHDNIPEMDPLKAVHSIHPVVNDIRYLAKAMRILGMSSSDRLYEMAEEIEVLAKTAANGICREAHLRYEETKKQTGEMIGMALTSCLSGGDSEREV